jgi:hypothetical protein
MLTKETAEVQHCLHLLVCSLSQDIGGCTMRVTTTITVAAATIASTIATREKRKIYCEHYYHCLLLYPIPHYWPSLWMMLMRHSFALGREKEVRFIAWQSR